MAKETKGKKKMSRKQKHRRRRKRILIIEVLLLLVLVGGLFVWSKFGMITFDKLDGIETNKLDAKTKEMLSGYQNIAFFGVDNRSVGEYDAGRSDSIMICSINNDTKEVKIVSVYRDTCLDIGDDNIRKATEAYNNGGVENSINMLNRNFDLDIEDYVAVDFYALTEAVDAVGGIELDITDEEAEIMNESYIDEVSAVTEKEGNYVTGGTQVVDGVQATAYCRIRYTAGDDFKRAERQRTVVTKLIEKAKACSVTELMGLVDAVFPSISTSMTSAQIAALVPAYKDYELVGTRGFPFSRTTGTFGSKGSLVVPCTLESNVNQLYEYLFGETDHEASDTVKELSDEIESFSGMGEEDGIEDSFADVDGAEEEQTEEE